MSESLYDCFHSETPRFTADRMFVQILLHLHKKRVCFTLGEFNDKSCLENFTHKHTHWPREQGPLSFFAKEQ